MGKDVIYTNGVIAAREKYLLKEKLLRLCEGKVEDAFRILLESGYGSVRKWRARTITRR